MIINEKKYFLNPKAEFDLADIWNYSFGNWGKNQADKYYESLIEGIHNILSRPTKMKSIEKNNNIYFLYQVKHHIIVHKWEDSKLKIVRFLHEKMDFIRHLN
jgi:toxin ParE1/3/4